MTREELENRMCVLLGGRAAERLVFHHLSTGAADDLAKVTDIARSMVMRYGMREELGHVAYLEERSPLQELLQPGAPRKREFSEETAREIDRAVREMVDKVYDRAVSILERNRKLLQESARALLDRETLGESDLAQIKQKIA
jgi:cell division protease FtsH